LFAQKKTNILLNTDYHKGLNSNRSPNDGLLTVNDENGITDTKETKDPMGTNRTDFKNVKADNNFKTCIADLHTFHLEVIIEGLHCCFNITYGKRNLSETNQGRKLVLF